MWSEVILRPQDRDFTAEFFCLNNAGVFHGSPPTSSWLSCPGKSRHRKKKPLIPVMNQKSGLRKTLSYISAKDTAAQKPLLVVCRAEKWI